MTKIIIDPGHGGRDPGAVWPPYREKDWALDISLHLAESLSNMGFLVSLTRETDITLTPQERTMIVRESGAATCISNHINSGGGRGAEVIHSIFSNGKLAGHILDELVKAGQQRRRIYSRESTTYPGRDHFFMNRDTGKVETVIVEYGFIDHQVDRQALANPTYRRQLALATAKGVATYFNRAGQVKEASSNISSFASCLSPVTQKISSSKLVKEQQEYY
ncbi:MAG: N-acetylmuramoyl-L-alanine amidase [Clostridia bacterium]|nr:N-acetylmuramoyl-L-alanine amidase [Clostridia bacterium]